TAPGAPMSERFFPDTMPSPLADVITLPWWQAGRATPASGYAWHPHAAPRGPDPAAVVPGGRRAAARGAALHRVRAHAAAAGAGVLRVPIDGRRVAGGLGSRRG